MAKLNRKQKQRIKNSMINWKNRMKKIIMRKRDIVTRDTSDIIEV